MIVDEYLSEKTKFESIHRKIRYTCHEIVTNYICNISDPTQLIDLNISTDICHFDDMYVSVKLSTYTDMNQSYIHMFRIPVDIVNEAALSDDFLDNASETMITSYKHINANVNTFFSTLQ